MVENSRTPRRAATAISQRLLSICTKGATWMASTAWSEACLAQSAMYLRVKLFFCVKCTYLPPP